ncbi:bifunctional ADP-dependent NAD(P)H-hydrate dehydratase/NAD(P)H-hydrate epimerase [soil metagenome]
MSRHLLFDSVALRRIEIEQAAILGKDVLMRRAGAAVARAAINIAAPRTGSIIVIAGPGNNGGDARIAADDLMREGFEVSCIDARELVASDAALAALPMRFSKAGLIVDGLLGIGLSRAITGPYAALVQAINAAATPVLAIDVPSGIDADTGRIVGERAGCCVHADHTLTLIADKPGLHMGAGSANAGRVGIDSLGLDLADASAPGEVNGPQAFASVLRMRESDSNKGSFGTCVLVGGSPGMAGAITLSARAALHAGAGRVVVHRVGADTDLDPLHPEIMWRSLDAFRPDQASCVVIGPGLGTTEQARDLLAGAWSQAPRLVIDADALTLLANDPGLAARARPDGASTCLTPHPLEAARLLGTYVAAINADRIAAARELARRYRIDVVLKGQGSVLASATSARWFINPTGNAGLASGGTGDVLAGVAGALLCRPGTDPAEALRAAVYLHGAAAEALVAAGVGPIGLTASELTIAIRSRLNRLIANQAS